MDCIEGTRPRPLLPEHRADLHDSGISDETIAANGIYSETDPEKVRVALRWNHPANDLGPCLAFPFPDLNGDFNGFTRFKPNNPRLEPRKDGTFKPVKYENPRGAGVVRAYTVAEARSAILSKTDRLLIVEGEKKCLCASQHGSPAVGLTGVDMWGSSPKDSAGRKTGARQLIKDLERISWSGRTVIIIFDTDPDHKPGVARAAAQLAQELSERGAIVHIVYLPLGPIGKNGTPTKMGIDDYIVAYGPDALRLLIDSAITPLAPRSIDSFRRDMHRARRKIIGSPGVYHDGSPTGSGKSSADIDLLAELQNSLTVLPSHRQCRQAEGDMKDAGLYAAAYIEANRDTCLNFDEFSAVADCGLSPSSAICQKCKHKDECEYQEAAKQAKNASHSIATQARAEHTIESMAKGRGFLSIHDGIACLRPVYEAREGFVGIVAAAEEARRFKSFDDSDDEFFAKLAITAEHLDKIIAEAQKTTIIPLEHTASPSVAAQPAMWKAICHCAQEVNSAAMRMCWLATSGKLEAVMVRVDRPRKKGGKVARKATIVGVRRVDLPPRAVSLISDGHRTTEEIAHVIGRPVESITPTGNLHRFWPTYQIPLDIGVGAKPEKFIPILEQVFELLPESFAGVGLIASQGHLPSILGTAKAGPTLREDLRRRIVKHSHYRSGETSGMNDWYQECQVLIAFGTPRVNPAALSTHLLRCRQYDALNIEPKWETDWWGGLTHDGRRIVVKTRGHINRDHRAAYDSMVKGELVQTIGRARWNLENGIPSIVVSAENLGYAMIDPKILKLTKSQKSVLESAGAVLSSVAAGELSERPAIEPLSDVSAIGRDESYRSALLNNHLAARSDRSVTTAALAEATGMAHRYVFQILCELEKLGFAKRNGIRGGWFFSQPTPISFDPAPADAAPDAMGQAMNCVYYDVAAGFAAVD